MIGVQDYGGGHQLMADTKSNGYTEKALTFMTGNTTSAFIFFYQDSGVSVVDDFVLSVAP
jgi:hypothetical protein